MGRALVACAGACDIEVVGVIASAHSPAVGQDAGEMAGVHRLGVAVTTDLGAALRAAQVVIDFSLPHFARDHVDQCALARAPLVLGTTGLPEDIEADLARAAVRIPLLVAPNTSLGVALLQDLVQRAAKALPADFDVSIAEAHHRAKKDAPSGTALALGRSVSAGREGRVEFAVVRGGDVVGEHSVRFLGTGEEVSLGHRATDRAIFARGALQAATWLAGQKPGRYSMRDVLGINSIT
ncbi:MAG: 4-hydroxy-tetrahydrodipicolinate reductase [Steroidobacteraceae bacterium]|nr:4-hydroxy-tetrahydrodipicolinate reductase [Steroidobacteraceae bacterium]